MLGGGGAMGDLERVRERVPDEERDCDFRWRRDESRSLLRFLDPIFLPKNIKYLAQVCTNQRTKTQHKLI